MTVVKFLSELQSIYGDFTSEGMQKAVFSRVSALTDTQRGKLFDIYCRNIPGVYKPDLKNILQCMEIGGITPPEKKKVCPSCGYKWSSSSVECPNCCYTKEEGDPRQYNHEFVNDCGRFNRKAVQELLSNMHWMKV